MWRASIDRTRHSSRRAVVATDRKSLHAGIRFVSERFVVYPMMDLTIKRKLADLPSGSAAAAIFLPDGRAPATGEAFMQEDLGRT